MAIDIRIVSTYLPTKCGIGTFTRDLATALQIHYTGEVGAIKVAAIDGARTNYDIPVDLIIDKNNPQSWRRGTSRIEQIAAETNNDTVVLLQHEFGLDSENDNGKIVVCKGHNYVNMVKQFSQNPDLINLVYLHTVPDVDKADAHQVETLQDLAKYSDGLIVTTQGAVDTLRGAPYNIPVNKLKHIDHGIRINQGDRLEVKKSVGAEGVFLATQLGLRSPDKGVQYTIQGVKEFVCNSLTASQREKFCCLIVGEYHPGFVAADGGVHYKKHKVEFDGILSESGLRIQKVKDLSEGDFIKNDIVIQNTFVSDAVLKNLYTATNTMILPYLKMEQVSSGIGADTLGTGRVPIATGFRWMREMLGSGQKVGDIEITSRGIIIEPGNKSIIGVAQGLDYLVFNKMERLGMEASSYERGHQMRWDYSAGNLLRYIAGISRAKKNITGRGVDFIRGESSELDVSK